MTGSSKRCTQSGPKRATATMAPYWVAKGLSPCSASKRALVTLGWRLAYTEPYLRCPSPRERWSNHGGRDVEN